MILTADGRLADSATGIRHDLAPLCGKRAPIPVTLPFEPGLAGAKTWTQTEVSGDTANNEASFWKPAPGPSEEGGFCLIGNVKVWKVAVVSIIQLEGKERRRSQIERDERRIAQTNRADVGELIKSCHCTVHTHLRRRTYVVKFQ